MSKQNVLQRYSALNDRLEARSKFSFLRKVFLCLSVVSLLFAQSAHANTETNTEKENAVRPKTVSDVASEVDLAQSVAPSQSALQSVQLDGLDLRGWDYIATRLIATGAPPNAVAAILVDQSFPQREELSFSIEPKESRYNYQKLNSKENRARALECYQRFRPYFDAAERDFGVPASVIVSILQVETACGKNTGSSPVFHRLLRLAAASTPENVAKNVERYRRDRDKPKSNVSMRVKKLPPAQLAREVKARAEYLEKTFTPHAAAVFEVAEYKRIAPTELEGSFAGAVGMPQFLPGHYLNFGVDGDRDGRIDLFTGEDAIPSVARYLNHFGWKSIHLPLKKQRAVIWEYNRSEPYIDTVLGIAKVLQPQILAIRKRNTNAATPTRLQPLSRPRAK